MAALPTGTHGFNGALNGIARVGIHGLLWGWEAASEDKINRPCLVLLLTLLASMGQDLCRRIVSVVWARRGDWTR